MRGLGSAGIGNAIQVGIDVGSLGALPPHRFCRQEAARRNGDSLVVNGQRALQTGDALLRLLQFIHGVAGNRLQVGNVVLQRIGELLVAVFRLGDRCVGSLLRRLRRRLRLAYLLLQLLNRLVAVLDLLLQLLNLLLLRRNGVFHVLQLLSKPARHCCGGRLRFRGGGICLCENARRDQYRER